MTGKTYWKDVRQSFSNSKGRVISIASLMALGAFALVGLKVTPPDMEVTAEHFFKEHNTADVAVVGDYGLSDKDQQLLESIASDADVEYGYLKDVVFEGTSTPIRIFSEPEKVSTYDLVEGTLPTQRGEIALTAAYQNQYKVGDKVKFSEKEGINGKTVLKDHEFTITGFVNSSEILSRVNMGQSTAGSGELQGYAVVTKDSFDSDVYMIARVAYHDLRDLSPFSQDYIDRVYNDKKALQDLFVGEPQRRLNEIKSEAQAKIDDGNSKIQEATDKLDEASKQLDEGSQKIKDGDSQLADAKQQAADGQATLDEAQVQLASGQAQLESAATRLADAKAQIDNGWATLSAKQQALSEASAKLNESKKQLDAAKAKLDATKQTLDQQEAALTTAKQQAEAIPDETVKAQTKAALAQKEQQLTAGKQQYEAGLAQYQQNETLYEQKVAEYDAGVDAYNKAEALLLQKQSEYQDGLTQYQTALATYEAKSAEYADGVAKLDAAKQTIADKEKELNDAKQTLAEKQKEYDEAKAKADPEIADKKKELEEAQERVDELSLPTYNVYTRREVPGSEGYISFENNASIVNNVGNIFPIVLYFIASLVTFVTMARFVDEERIKAGTFKALGYNDRDIIRKFLIYGFVTSMIGTAIGLVAGHLLLPNIIYNTYSSKIVVAPLEYHFYPWITLATIGLGLISAVLPAYLAARKELSEKPAQLLLPKPPTSGSKILLERITPLWNRMSFTQKVTARNIFRYKQRMFMTIFGVCGSIALLFAGLGIRSSIADLNNRQFVNIIKYDMIVADKEHTSAQQETEISDLLKDPRVESSMGLHYEKVTKVAGAKQDEQAITTLVVNPSEASDLSKYIELKDRATGEELSLDGNGVILSEKIANLTNTKVGDDFTVRTSDGKEITVKVDGIAEMYMSHFMVMNEETYEKAFGKVATDNANLILLNDHSREATAQMAAKFMELDGVKGVVQNTSLKAQVETIVESLNRVMGVLVGASVLLAIVVLYNLTNINVSERIRELSTIKVLGFYNNEVTMYIYRETIYLSLIGILVGFAVGLGLHSYMLSIIPPDTVMFNPAVSWLIYAVPAVVVVMILAVLGIVVNRWLKRVDMLEALKSVE